MLDESPLVLSDLAFSAENFIELTRILFGVDPAKLPDDFWDSVFKAISDRFPALTVSDVHEAFSCAEIEKKQYVSLTRDEVLKPIKDYWRQKSAVLDKIQDIHLAEQKEINRVKRENNFDRRAWKAFRISFEIGEWIGNQYQATHLVKSGIGGNILQPLLNMMWFDAQLEFLRSQDAIKTSKHIGSIVKEYIQSDRRIYATKVVRCLVENKINPVIPK